MAKDRHPQAAKEAAGNVLPAWLDPFNVLLDLDPRQDVSGEHWDGLEIRVQIFRLPRAYSSVPQLVSQTWWGRTDCRHGTSLCGLRRRGALGSEAGTRLANGAEARRGELGGDCGDTREKPRVVEPS